MKRIGSTFLYSCFLPVKPEQLWWPQQTEGCLLNAFCMPKHNSCLCQTVGDAVKGHGRFHDSQLGWPRDIICLIVVLPASKPASVLCLTRTTQITSTTKIPPQKYCVHSLRSTGQIIFKITEYWQEPAVIPPSLFVGTLFYQQRWRPAWHSCNLSLQSHDSSCCWCTCSNTFRNWKMHTYTSAVPKSIHLDDTIIFLLVCFVSFGFSVFQELVNIVLLQLIFLVKVPYL